MAQTRITRVFGEKINGKFESRIEPGTIGFHAQGYIQAGWLVAGSSVDGSVTVEKGGTRYHLGEYDGTEVQSEKAEKIPTLEV